MGHGTGLLTTIAVALGVALLFGFMAARLRLPPLVGYLLAGVAIGPFTPGSIGDTQVAAELAEVGVILLMFGVGVHFSVGDLLAVRRIAVPAALAQIGIATALATGVAVAIGWSVEAGIVLGIALAISSTVVLVRTLVERSELDSPAGRVAVGWLVVEDIFTVAAIVVLPTLTSFRDVAAHPEVGLATLGVVATSVAKVLLLAAAVYAGGTRAVPWLLAEVAKTGSRELFTLSVLGIALGIAVGASTLLGIPLALGAFLAGAAIAESELGHRAATEALPFRDAFAVLFFVSVGMLLDPGVLTAAPLALVVLVAFILVGKSIPTFATMLLYGYPIRAALTLAAGRAQIGEFSFILARLGEELGILTPLAHQLVLAAAIVSIALNPLLFRLVPPLEERLARSARMGALARRRAGDLGRLPEQPADGDRRGHAIICGLGQVGALIADVVERRNFPYVAIELDRRLVERRRKAGDRRILYGDAADRVLLARAGIATASLVIVAIPDPPTTRRIVDQARAMHPGIDIVARTHSESEWRYLRAGRVSEAVLGERELAIEMAGHALRRFGVSALEIVAITQGLRRR